MIDSDIASGIAVLFRSVGKANFGPALDALTHDCAPFDMSCVFGFSKTGPPVVIYDGYSKTVSREALGYYLRGAYLFDPFYSASITHPAEGLWRMKDLAPDAYREAEFQSSHLVHPCISDEAGTLVEEIGYIVPFSSEFGMTYSLMRNRGNSSFDDAEINTLRKFLPIVSESLRLHWAVSHAFEEKKMTSTTSRDAFHEAFSTLTPAQRTVTRMVLEGHSNASIAGNLGIAEGTVKQHRYNIYQRLEISSQSELFRRFIDFLRQPD